MYSGDYLQYDSGSAYAYAYGYGYGMYGGFLTWGYPCSSSISIVFSIINHPFWGSPIYETHIYIYIHIIVNMYINHHFMGFSPWEIHHPPQSSAKETDGFVAIAQEASDQGGACTWEERANEKSNEKWWKNHGKPQWHHRTAGLWLSYYPLP